MGPQHTLTVFHNASMTDIKESDVITVNKRDLMIEHQSEDKSRKVKPIHFETEVEAGLALRKICNALLEKDSSLDLNIK